MRFDGEYLDGPTSLYNLRARAYDSATGRFLGIDPLGRLLQQTGTSNYLFADDQPTRLVDPSGLGAVHTSCAGSMALCWIHQTVIPTVKSEGISCAKGATQSSGFALSGGPSAPVILAEGCGIELFVDAVGALLPEPAGKVVEGGAFARDYGKAGHNVRNEMSYLQSPTQTEMAMRIRAARLAAEAEIAKETRYIWVLRFVW
jgi:RHS repeat-associated protein